MPRYIAPTPEEDWQAGFTQGKIDFRHGVVWAHNPFVSTHPLLDDPYRRDAWRAGWTYASQKTEKRVLRGPKAWSGKLDAKGELKTVREQIRERRAKKLDNQLSGAETKQHHSGVSSDDEEKGRIEGYGGARRQAVAQLVEAGQGRQGHPDLGLWR